MENFRILLILKANHRPYLVIPKNNQNFGVFDTSLMNYIFRKISNESPRNLSKKLVKDINRKLIGIE